MSSGQKAWEEDQEVAAFNAHKERLEALGFGTIAVTIEEIKDNLQFLTNTLVLPRAGWTRVDRIQELVRKLS